MRGLQIVYWLGLLGIFLGVFIAGRAGNPWNWWGVLAGCAISYLGAKYHARASNRIRIRRQELKT